MDPLTIALLAAAGYGGYRFTKSRRAAQTAPSMSTPQPTPPPPLPLVASPNAEAAIAETSSSPTRPRRSDGRGLFASHLFDAV